MPDQHQLKLVADARFLAIEFIVTRLFAFTHRNLTEGEFDALLGEYWLALDAATIPGVDAVTSDAIAGEIRDAVQMLLSGAKIHRGTVDALSI
jgi:hypothetical protein